MIGEQIRVMLVDDHPLIVDGLSYFLNCQQDIKVVAQTLDGSKVIPLIEENEPDILVLDLEMPYHGLKVLDDIQQESVAITVLVLTGFDDQKNINLVHEHGGAGFVSKSESFSTIATMIRQLAQGWTIFPKKAPTKPLSEPVHISDDNVLSTRELEVIELLSQGLTNSEIATTLHVSRNTVGFHLKNIFSKLNVNNRTEATVWYFTNMTSFS